MKRDGDAVRLQHLLDAARKAVFITAGKQRDDLEQDEILSLALVRLLEIIGEAAKHLSEPFRVSQPDIPWRLIAGTRDRLIHGYFDVDYDVVWAIVTEDLPPVIEKLESITK